MTAVAAGVLLASATATGASAAPASPQGTGLVVATADGALSPSVSTADVDLVDVTLPADRAGVVDVLAALYPAERPGIEWFLELVHDVFLEWIGFTYMGGAQADPDEAKKKYPLFTHYALRTLREVLDELFVSQTLKTVLASYWDYLGQTPGSLAFLDYAVIFDGYKPAHIEGGSQAMPNALLDQFQRLGGEVCFSCGADAILTEDGRVKAVRTADGDTVSCQARPGHARDPGLDLGSPAVSVA